MSIQVPLMPNDYESFYKNDAYLFAVFLTEVLDSEYVTAFCDSLDTINK